MGLFSWIFVYPVSDITVITETTHLCISLPRAAPPVVIATPLITTKASNLREIIIAYYATA